MTIPQSVAEILQKHVTLEVIDRMHLTSTFPVSRSSRAYWISSAGNRGYPVASTHMGGTHHPAGAVNK
jgi:hypothetical protein